jgi:hypothetical protein
MVRVLDRARFNLAEKEHRKRFEAPDKKSRTRTSTIGGKGIRTPDLLIANETLYQLSYTPTIETR